MKTYHYEVNGCISGFTVARNRWDARRYCKKLTKRFCPNTKIKSIKVFKIKTNEPLAVEV